MQKFQVTGNSPSARFGHAMTQVTKTKLLLFGGAVGNTGQYSFSNDSFLLDLQTKIWKKIQSYIFSLAMSIKPSARAAHGLAAIENMKAIIYGGATGSNLLLSAGQMASQQLYLLTIKDEIIGQWNILKTQLPTPGKRYGHTLNFLKPFLIVFGGNKNRKSEQGKQTQQPTNDTWLLNLQKQPLIWQSIQGQSPPARIYHSAAICQQGSANGMMVIFGGRASDQIALNTSWGLRKHRKGNWDWTKAPYKMDKQLPVARYQHSSVFIGSLMIIIGGRNSVSFDYLSLDVYDTESSQWKSFVCPQRFRHCSWVYNNDIYTYGGFQHESPNIPTDSIQKINLEHLFRNCEQLTKKLFVTANTTNIQPMPHTPVINERPKNNTNKKSLQPAVFQGNSPSKGCNIANHFLTILCGQKALKGNYQLPYRFIFEAPKILQLCQHVENILKNQPMILRVFAPVKIYGDVHGQYTDLLTFFKLYGSPVKGSQDGDIQGYDYIFLGDFVDRGNHSLETVCLLFALKAKYPKQIHLIRGNHQDRGVNNGFGFSEECENRIGQNPLEPDSIFNKVNDVFDYLPLASLVQDKIICLHGGIGGSVKTLHDIEKIPRPLQVVHQVMTNEEQIVVDILWSDPTENDAELGIQPNVIRDPQGTGNIVKFGPDRVQKFLKTNQLSLIIRAHECVMDGFERFAGGSLITIFSATDYCGKHKNAGAMLTLKKNCEIIPKLIYPNINGDNHSWIEDQQALKKRPPTPPRWKSTNRKYS